MRRLLVAVMVLALNWAQCPVWAQVPAEPVPEVNTAAEEAAAEAAVEAALNLNLSSTVASLAAPMTMTAPVNVNLGGVLTSINPGSAVTPAQMVALHQVMQTGVQTLVLDSFGAAQSGTFSLTSLGQSLASLTIPQGVTALAHASEMGPLNMSGNLVNSGSFYLYSTNPDISAASVSALNILNNQGAVLSTALPSVLLASLPSALSSLSLNLSAINDIVNAGTISSSGNLSLYAGGSITNVGANSVMQAMQSLALTSMAGNITNSGLMAANFGNINVNAAQVANMTVNNLNGVMQALNGSINFRDEAYLGTASTTLSGGDYLSKVLNLYGGTGSVDVNVNNVTGVLNAWAECARVAADSPLLQLGILQATGDPYVTVTGNLDLSSTTYAPYLAAIAGESIFTSQPSTAMFTGGGNLVLIAGATPVDASGTCANCITVDRSEVGGDIHLISGGTFNGSVASQDIVGLEVSNSAGSGGNLTLIAFADSETGQTFGGHVYLPTSVTIQMYGTGSNTNGNLTIVAEAASGSANAISMGNVQSTTTNFASGGGGTVTLQVATPNAGPSGPTINTSNGVITGSFTSSDLQIGAITTGNIVTGGAFADATHTAGSVNISTDGAITTGVVNAAGIAGGGAPRNTAFNGNAQWGQNGGHGSNISLSAGGLINTQSIVSFGAGGGGGAGASVNTSLVGGEGGSGGNGGNIFVSTTSTAINAISVTGDLNSSGGGGGGGGGGSITNGGVFFQAGPGGDGGVGGDAGTISISGSSVSVTGGLYAVGGGEGGAGMVGAILQFDSPGGGGGGGGGSFGGAGGGGGGGSGRRHTGASGASESGRGGGSGISYDGAGFGEDGFYSNTLSFQWGGAGGGGVGNSQNLSNTPPGDGGGGGTSGGFSGVPLLPPGESGFNAGGAGESGSSDSISLQADAISVTGVINAKNSLVEISAYFATSIIIGASGSTPSVLYLDSGLLSSITAETLSLGSSSYAGGIYVSTDTFFPYDANFRTSPTGGVETISGVLSTNSLTIEAGYIGGALQPLLISAPNLSARSLSGDVHIQDNTSVNLFNSGAAPGVIIEYHILVPVSGSSITIQSPIVVEGAGGLIHLSADGDILDPSDSTLQATNINLSGNNIGDVDHPMLVAAGVPGGVVNLSLTSANDYIADTNLGESINLGPINSTGSISIVENGSITVSAPVSVSGTFTLTTLAGSNGSIVVNDTISAQDKITLSADGSGEIAINAGIDSNDADIILTAANVVATSSIDAGSGAVYLIPSSSQPVVINGASVGPTGTFYVTSGLLDQIHAETVFIGSSNYAGATTLANPLFLGSAFALNFNFVLSNTSSFNANGNSIQAYERSVSIVSDSHVQLADVTVEVGALVVVARTDITFTNIDAQGANGSNVVLVAGADYTTNDDMISVTGASGDGGSIMQNVGGTMLQTQSNVSGGSGGHLTLIALASTPGATDLTGRIMLQSSTVVRASGDGGQSGDVLMLADGGTGSGAAISVNTIDTSGGSAGSGSVTLETVTANGSTLNPVVVDALTGDVTGNFCCGSVQNSSILVESIFGVGESLVTIHAGNRVKIDGVLLSGGTGQNGGSLVITSGDASGVSPLTFRVGDNTQNGINGFNLSPGSGASNFGDLSIFNYGSIAIEQQISADQVVLTTLDDGGTASGAISDPHGGLGTVMPYIFANEVNLETEGTGPVDTSIGMSIDSNGPLPVRLTAKSGEDSVTIKSFGDVDIVATSGAGLNKVFDLRTTSGSNGSIIINHDVIVNGSSGLINLNADGTGTITRPNFAGTLFANTVNLTSGSGDLGTDNSHIDMQTPNVTFSTTGSMYLQTVGAHVLPVMNFSLSQTFSFRVGADSSGNASIMLTNNGANPTIRAGAIKFRIESSGVPGFISQQASPTIASLSAPEIHLHAYGTSPTVNVTTTNNFNNLGVNFNYDGHAISNVRNIGDLKIMHLGGSNGSLHIKVTPDALGNADISVNTGLFIHMPNSDLTLETLGALSTITTNQLATSSSNGGGDLRVITQGGDITVGDIFTDNLNTSRTGLPGGNVELITGTASVNGGNIIVGNIKASSYTFPIFNMTTFHSNGKGGNVTLTSQGSTDSGFIQTGTINTEGDRGGGAVTIVSEFKSISTQSITTFNGARLIGIQVLTPGVNGGNVSLTARRQITVTGSINTNAKADFLSTGQPNFSRTSGYGGQVLLHSDGFTASSGAITVTGDIITLGDWGAGDVVIETLGGDIQLANILAQNVDSFVATAVYVDGSVSITSGTNLVNGGNIVVGSIDTNSRMIAFNNGHTGGDVTISTLGTSAATGTITLNGNIDAIGKIASGDVTLRTMKGDVSHTAGTIIADGLILSSAGGDFGGDYSSSGRPLTTQVSTLQYDIAGNLNLEQSGDLIIETSEGAWNSTPENRIVGINIGSGSFIRIAASGSIFFDGFMNSAQEIRLEAGVDILNLPAMSGIPVAMAGIVRLLAGGTVGLPSDPLRVVSVFTDFTSPNYVNFYTIQQAELWIFTGDAPVIVGAQSPIVTELESSLLFDNIATEANDLNLFDEGGHSQAQQIIANSNVNILQGGEQVVHDIQVASHNSVENNINSQNFMGSLGDNSLANQAPADDQALGQNFAYCNTGDFNSTSVGQMQSHGATIGSATTGNLCILQQGNFLFQPQSDITVQVQEGSVDIPKGATALVMETGNDVAVFDIADGPHARVRVKSGNKIITLSPGKQVVLTRQLNADFDQINPSKLIGYKNPKGQLVASDIRAYSADFSLPSVMMSVAPMKRMLTSDSPADRKLVQRMIKNAVVLSMLPSKSGPFKTSGNTNR